MNKTFIFTFMQRQEELKNCFVRIHADNVLEAIKQMEMVYGDQWAFCYSSEEQAGVQRFNLQEIPLARLTPTPGHADE